MKGLAFPYTFNLEFKKGRVYGAGELRYMYKYGRSHIKDLCTLTQLLYSLKS